MPFAINMHAPFASNIHWWYFAWQVGATVSCCYICFWNASSNQLYPMVSFYYHQQQQRAIDDDPQESIYSSIDQLRYIHGPNPQPMHGSAACIRAVHHQLWSFYVSTTVQEESPCKTNAQPHQQPYTDPWLAKTKAKQSIIWLSSAQLLQHSCYIGGFMISEKQSIICLNQGHSISVISKLSKLSHPTNGGTHPTHPPTLVAPTQPIHSAGI